MSIESLIDQITSPNLQDDDYSLLLDLVELVNKNPSVNVTDSIRFLKVKLQSNNANTLLRSLTLLDFLAQNCGAMMKANIANENFVNNSLISIINDSLIHISVKFNVVKEIYKLSKLFNDDESLSIMKSTFNNLKLKFPNLCNQAIDEIDGKNSTNSKLSLNYNPTNSQQDDDDIELKKAIELSLQDSVPSRQQQSIQQPQQSQQLQQPVYQSPPPQQSLQIPTNSYMPQLSPQISNQPNQSPPKIITPIDVKKFQEDCSKPEKVVALYDLNSDDEDTLSFKKDDIITIVEEINNDWLRGCLNGRAGIIPTNYVKKIPRTVENDLENLINALNGSFDIEMTLSQLMDLNKKVKTTSMTSQQFESTLLSNSFPNKIQKIEEIKINLKQILELHKLKLLELNSLQLNIDNSLKIYQSLITEMIPTPNDPTISKFIQTYPDISSLSLNPQSTATASSPQTIQPQYTQQQQIPSNSTGSVNHYLQQQQQQQQQQNPNMYNY
ncbi:ESCRT-0 subunit protein hse1 [Pichia californica]|uniref:Class E vacuolar protein-sorting machinery protein HSE1 n=1 Tax=Pichia californica TaxID=460514 RepID=A0A9P6WM74_9ASCO|nr:ESCRT-0 subunit protein hse1 [[Candida] californica]KAG0689489.1 ESCRT-0 subunit protein hse1 [[Candida] californica]